MFLDVHPPLEYDQGLHFSSKLVLSLQQRTITNSSLAEHGTSCKSLTFLLGCGKCVQPKDLSTVWGQMCSCLAMSRRHCFLIVIHCLWLLPYFFSLFCNDPCRRIIWRRECGMFVPCFHFHCYVEFGWYNHFFVRIFVLVLCFNIVLSFMQRFELLKK